MELGDYSHCHYWNFERQCIAFDCDECEYKRQRLRLDDKKIDLSGYVEWENLFKI